MIRRSPTRLEALLLILIGMAMGWALPGHPTGRLEVGALLDGAHASVWAGPEGWYAGRWEMGAPASVAYSPNGIDRTNHWATFPGNFESASGGVWIDGVWHVATESPDGPAILRMDGPGTMTELARFGEGMLYAFPGRGAMTVSSGHERGIPGRLATWNGSTYELSGPGMRDELGRALMAWDALMVEGRWMAACAWSGRYNQPDAGRVLVGGPDGWTVTPLRAGGVIQLTRPSFDPDHVHALTAWGEWWRGDLAGQSWELLWQGPRGHDLRLSEDGGEPLLISSAGGVYRGWQPQKVAGIAGCTSLNLVRGPEGRLAGTAEIDGSWHWVVMHGQGD